MKIKATAIKNSLIIILSFTFLDQLSKFLARKYLESSDLIPIIPNFIDLTLVENKGVSFSFLSNLPDYLRLPLLTIIPFIVVIGIYYYMYKKWDSISLYEIFAYEIIIAGAIGNLIDRIFRQSVTDFMYFHFFENGFFINNFADDLISIGFVILVINSLFQKKRSPPDNPLKFYEKKFLRFLCSSIRNC